MRERVIETTQITKTYGKVLALDHVDICVKRGDIYGLIGDNGAGKSTLLKLLAGHSAASTGEIRLLGEQGEGTAKGETAQWSDDRTAGLFRKPDSGK